MRFKQNLICAGEGRLSSAVQCDDAVWLVVRKNGSLRVRRLRENSRQLSGERPVGYGDDCAFVPFGKIERLAEEVRCVYQS